MGSECQHSHPYSAALQIFAQPIVAVTWDNGISHLSSVTECRSSTKGKDYATDEPVPSAALEMWLRQKRRDKDKSSQVEDCDDD